MKYKICKKTKRSIIDGSVVSEHYEIKYKTGLFWKWSTHSEWYWCGNYSVRDKFSSVKKAEQHVHNVLFPGIIIAHTNTETECGEIKTI